MAKLREMLEHAGFHWQTGVIVYQHTEDDTPGWACKSSCLPSVVIAHDHPVLDLEFDNGYGGPEMPRFVANDSARLYFPVQYDGATHICAVYRNASDYCGITDMTPYPGG
jgi:hypothetical protein